MLENICFGHSRLSIIDLSNASNQPFEDYESNLSMVYNGCIYNYIDLRNKLIKKGHFFRTSGDTEVVLKSYLEWGEECVNFFEGDFAIAIWDNNRKRLFLFRDRFGVKPLYFTNSRNFFRFGSTLQSIIVKNDIDLSLDEKSLHMHFSLHAVVPAPDTLFKNIKKVPPGYYLTIDENKKISIIQYWKLESPDQKKIITNENEATETIEYLLKESIEKRLAASDIDVGVLLSGGLDSSMIVALAKQKFPNLKTYSIGFEDDKEEKGNEFIYSDQVVKKYKTDHKKFIINNTLVLSKLPKAFEAMSACEDWGKLSQLMTPEGSDIDPDMVCGCIDSMVVAYTDYLNNGLSDEKMEEKYGTTIAPCEPIFMDQNALGIMMSCENFPKFSELMMQVMEME